MKNFVRNTIGNQKGFAPIVLVLFGLLAGIVIYKLIFDSGNTNFTPPILINPRSPQVIKRSTAMGFITTVTTAKDVDPKTKQPINPTENFTVNDKHIFMLLNLNTPPVGTRIDYIRYLNGRYVDHQSIQINQAGTKLLVFDWSKTTVNGKRQTGTYRVKLYSNGILEKRANYNVGTSNLSSSQIFIDQLLDLFI